MIAVPRGARSLAPALLAAALLSGCHHTLPRTAVNFSVYHHPEFYWRAVGRVLVLPVVNETTHPEATDQMRRSLDAELQQLGLFEVVPTPPHAALRMARSVREDGRFDEAEAVALARCTRADVLLVVTLSHYSPYYRPRVGLTVQAISPDLGKVVASVDGLWDSNNHDVYDRARRFYSRVRTPAGHVRDHIIGTFDDSFGQELATESPHLFQRFVASEVARLLVGDPEMMAWLQPPPPPRTHTRWLTVSEILDALCPWRRGCPSPEPPAEPRTDPKAANDGAAKEPKSAPPAAKNAPRPAAPAPAGPPATATTDPPRSRSN